MTVLEMDKGVADHSRKEQADAVVGIIAMQTKRALAKATGIQICMEVERRLTVLAEEMKKFSDHRQALGASSAEAETIIEMAKGIALMIEWQLAVLRAQIDFVLAD